MKTTKLDREAQICEALSGRRIVFAGLSNAQREIYEQNLIHLFRQKQVNVMTADHIKQVTEKDLVLIFGQIEEDTEKKTSVQHTKRRQLLSLTEQLAILAEKRPAGAVLISDCQVYGKQFGAPHNWKENELGFLSHTDPDETAFQYMRMAEHLACRLAQEEQLHIRVVRQNLQMEKENLGQVIEVLLMLLLYGADGEIYNLPQSGQPWIYGEAEKRSPLEPLELILDTEKADAAASVEG